MQLQLNHMTQKMSMLLALGFVGLLCGFPSCCEPGVEANEVSKTNRWKTCGNLQYDAHEAVCCDQNLPPEAGKACCGKKPYDPREATCCGNGTAHVTWGLSEEVSSCCGLTAYNPLNQICCASKVYDKPSPLAACCDKVPYNVEKQLCCGKTGERKIEEKVSETTLCCGNKTYNSSTHCCSTNISTFKVEIHKRPSPHCKNNANDGNKAPSQSMKDKEAKKTEDKHKGNDLIRNLTETRTNLRLCYSPDTCGAAVTPYNPQTQICCGGLVSERDPQKNQCCGTTPYNLAQRGVLCCNDTLYEGRGDAEECSELGIPYNPDKGTVCNAVYHVRPGKHCCGPHTYEPHTQICCKGHVHEKTANVMCCGVKAYNIKEEKCCSGTVYGLAEQRSCCGSTLINKTNQVCCSSVEKELVYTSQGGFSCCGHHYYNKSLWSCCAGTPRPGPQSKTHHGITLVSMNNVELDNLCNKMHTGILQSVNQTHVVFNNVLKINGRTATVEPLSDIVLTKDCSFPKLVRGKSYFFDRVHVFVDLNYDFLQSLYFILFKCSSA